MRYSEECGDPSKKNYDSKSRKKKKKKKKSKKEKTIEINKAAEEWEIWNEEEVAISGEEANKLVPE